MADRKAGKENEKGPQTSFTEKSADNRLVNWTKPSHEGTNKQVDRDRRFEAAIERYRSESGALMKEWDTVFSEKESLQWMEELL